MQKRGMFLGLALLVLGGVSMQLMPMGAAGRAASADHAVARELFKKVDYEKHMGYTQSQAHLMVPAVREKVSADPFGFAESKAIIKTIFERERTYNRTHCVFYTAIPKMHLFQDVTRELYKRKFGAVGELKKDAFQFVRYSYNSQLFNTYKDIPDMLEKNISAYGIIDDASSVRNMLLSTNIALFGNAGFQGESTWRFFNTPQEWVQVDKKYLEDCIKSFGYSTHLIDKLMRLNELLKDKHGNMGSDLFQIFVPEDKVNQVGYLSWRYGIPYDEAYLTAVLKSQGFSLSITNDDIKKVLANFIKQYQAGDRTVNGIAQGLLAKIRNTSPSEDQFNLEPFLFTYRTNPNSIAKMINYAQARLLITNSMLLNPQSGILIYRYSKIAPDVEAHYKRELERIIQQMDLEKESAEYRHETHYR